MTRPSVIILGMFKADCVMIRGCCGPRLLRFRLAAVEPSPDSASKCRLLVATPDKPQATTIVGHSQALTGQSTGQRPATPRIPQPYIGAAGRHGADTDIVHFGQL